MSAEKHNMNPIHYKILISLIFKNPKKSSKKVKYWIQNQPYKFGLKIKNIDDKATPQFTIKNLSLGKPEGVGIVYNNDEEFSVPVLNPEEEINIWWPDPMGSIIQGSTWIKCNIVPPEGNIFIDTYQFDKFSQKPQLYNKQGYNQWGEGISIRGEMEEEQSKTNSLLLILTILMFLDGVWGLNKIAKVIVEIFASLLLNIAKFLLKII